MGCGSPGERNVGRSLKHGWKVGTAEEFPGLSAAESAYVELRLRLSETLRKRRLKKSLSQNDSARLIRSSQSRVARMEGADPTVSLDLLIRSLLAPGASRRDLARATSPTQSKRAS